MARPKHLEQAGHALRDYLVQHARNDEGPDAAMHRTLAKVAALAAGTTVGLGATATAAASMGKTSSGFATAMIAKWFVVGAATATLSVGVARQILPSTTGAPTPGLQRLPAPVTPRARDHGPNPAPPASSAVEPMVVAPSPAATRRAETHAASAETAPAAIPMPAPPPSRATAAAQGGDSRAAPIWRSELLAPASDSPGAPPTSDPPASEFSHPSPQTSSHLARELALLEQARMQITGGHSSSALDLLHRYDAEFPLGGMSSEAAALHVEALARSGQREKARAEAEAFLARYPRSPLADRVRMAIAP